MRKFLLSIVASVLLAYLMRVSLIINEILLLILMTFPGVVAYFARNYISNYKVILLAFVCTFISSTLMIILPPYGMSNLTELIKYFYSASTFIPYIGFILLYTLFSYYVIAFLIGKVIVSVRAVARSGVLNS